MALVAMVMATVTYACRLSEEDEQKIRDYIGDTDPFSFCVIFKI